MLLVVQLKIKARIYTVTSVCFDIFRLVFVKNREVGKLAKFIVLIDISAILVELSANKFLKKNRCGKSREFCKSFLGKV